MSWNLAQARDVARGVNGALGRQDDVRLRLQCVSCAPHVVLGDEVFVVCVGP